MLRRMARITTCPYALASRPLLRPERGGHNTVRVKPRQGCDMAGTPARGLTAQAVGGTCSCSASWRISVAG
jgi:hypothetical protein